MMISVCVCWEMGDCAPPHFLFMGPRGWECKVKLNAKRVMDYI